MSEYQVSEHSRIRRLPKRATYDRATIHAILDAAFLCHVGFVVDGRPVVIPTAYVRDHDSLILHGSAASRMLRGLSTGVPVTISVAIVDGLVLARSAFHHSINYRSVVMFGTATLVEDVGQKSAALEQFMEHLTPGRWAESRLPTENELRGTAVLRFEIEQASAKIRSGDPVDDAADHSLDVWAGVVPLRLAAGLAERSRDLRDEIRDGESLLEIAKRWSR